MHNLRTHIYKYLVRVPKLCIQVTTKNITKQQRLHQHRLHKRFKAYVIKTSENLPKQNAEIDAERHFESAC